MSETTAPRENLGAGALIGESFSLVFGNLGTLITIGAIPALIAIALNILVLGPIALNGTLAITDPDAYLRATQDVSGGAQTVVTIIGVLLWAFAAAALTKAAFDARQGGPVSVSAAYSTALSVIVPVILVSVVAGIVASIGFALLILPGLYIAAVWWVLIPVAVLEKGGFGSLGRSAALTKEYRWPLVGLIVLFLLVYVAITIAVFIVQFLLLVLGTIGLVLVALITVGLTAFGYALGAAVATLAYLRLLEIKEGASNKALADVFG